MNGYQIVALAAAVFLIGYSRGCTEAEVRIQANAPIVCTTDGKVVTCK